MNIFKFKRVITVVLCVCIMVSNIRIYASETNISNTNESTTQIETNNTYVENNNSVGSESNILSENHALNDTSNLDNFHNGNNSEFQTNNENIVEPTNTISPDNAIVSNFDNVYLNGNIRIYNQEQFLSIGTNKVLKSLDDNSTTFNTGEDVVVDGNLITYSLNANYIIENNIDINELSCNLPKDFTGKFINEVVNTNNRIYDETTNTIYIYNSFQLDLINNNLDPTKEASLVLTNDYDANLFGSGKMIYVNGGQEPLKYDNTHNYVIAKEFTEKRPLNNNLELQVNQATNEIVPLAVSRWINAKLDGRDRVGQVYKEINGIKYILIGNKQQLAAIGNNKQVTPTLVLHKKGGLLNWSEEYIPFYPGDADFDLNIGLNLDKSKTNKFKYFEKNNSDLMYADFNKGLLNGIVGIVDDLLGSLTTGNSEVLGYDGARYISESELKREYENLKYSKDANYIIFRDIDLMNVDWKPLLFNGNIIGAKSTQPEIEGTLWQNNIIAENQVVISNININQLNPIDVEKESGVGFFGSIMSTSSKQIGLSDKQVSVKNIKLQNISVQNNTTTIKDSTGLIGVITGLLGGVAGLLLGDLGKALDVLLNPNNHKDATVFATGTFAGRIFGDVLIENCAVENIQNLSNSRDILGGFAGHVEGMTEYGKLQQSLGTLVNVLEKVLNIIPLVDLGTLINVLLDGNIIKLDQLIPTAYKTPKIINCHINQTVPMAIGRINQKSVGGFFGNAIGVISKNNSINAKDITVSGSSLVGGFAGLVSNAELVGLLENLGVDLINTMRLNSFILGCNINATNLNVTASDRYAGGISGALANSFIVDSTIKSNVNVDAKNYAGGFTGIAGLGQAISLGKEFYTGNKNLIQSISGLLSGILTGEQENMLLSLVGISPSVLSGSLIDGSLTVKTIENFAGGLVGRGDGVKIIPSSKLNEKSFIWNKSSNNLAYTTLNRNTLISDLININANNFSGGLIGEATTANAGGIIDKTLGIGNFIAFDIDDAKINSVNGANISSINECAGGLAGRAIGGIVNNSEISNVLKVEANNYAAGFVGYAGTGSLAETGGLNILGIDLVKISNLLSLADGIVVKMNNSNVIGSNLGFSVVSNGENALTSDVKKYYAGGFVARSTSAHISNCHVYNLKDVVASMKTGYAGGFAGMTETGGLAQAAGKDTNALQLLKIEGLLNAIPYLVSKYNDVSVSFTSNNLNPQVMASHAGGFVGKMQSGYVINDNLVNPYAVYNIKNVEGEYFAGGFAGEIIAGGLASSNDLSILGGVLNIGLNDLLGILNVYIPKISKAGVMSYDIGANNDEKLKEGLIVKCNSIDELDSNSASAGGFAGYASAVRISHSDVKQLKHTKVVPPSDLNSDIAPSYYDLSSQYAVTAKHYAGGYVGKLDIGNTASLGGGLSLLGIINLTDITDALAVAASKIEYSDVYGAVGGYSIISNGIKNNSDIGNAGGYAGAIYGAQLQGCDSYNFEYIIGKESAGGYVGVFEPGDVASVLGTDLNVLKGLLSSDNLLSVLQSFIPMIYNSETTAVPCGGAVRSDAVASDGHKRGLAGGYVGNNLGGRIEGNSTREWNKLVPSEIKENAVYRLRSVYGYEFAGGFSGRSESANVVDTGGLKVLFNFIKVDNPLKAIRAIYFTHKDTAVYGPLRGLDVDTWNNWIKYVGINGVYGEQFKNIGQVLDQTSLDKIIEEYAYGYDVKSGRIEAGNLAIQGGVAGGYIGRMDGGLIEKSHAKDLKLSIASRSCGGFAGEMMTAGVVELGGISLVGIDITGSIPLIQTFVPVIKTSKTIGYKSGASIMTHGTDLVNRQGNAGGYVGTAVGGQIYGLENNFCSIEKLKTVRGTNNVGGFAGNVITGNASKANVGSNDGLLNSLLGPLLGNVKDLAKVLNATLSKIEYAKVDSWDEWGIEIDGTYQLNNQAQTKYAYAVGGFVGNVSGAIIGDRNSAIDSAVVNNIKEITGGEHVGGFFGIADVSALAEVGENNSSSILGLIKLGELDVLDAFRTYIYHARVNGSNLNGLSVYANEEKLSGTLNSKVYSGNAGGFGGSLLNGSIKKSSVTNLSQVEGLNYCGGFVGHLGKSGSVDLDKVATGVILPGLLNATAGVLDNFGSHIDDSVVSGINGGFTIKGQNGSENIVGGFAGYADLARIKDCNVNNLKKVTSNQIAGGFVGKTNFSYLTDIDAGSKNLLNPVLKVVNALLDILYIGNLQNINFIEIDLGTLLKLDVLANGNTLSVTLLGLPISVALIKNNGNGTTDVAQIHIGDSYIELPCTNTKGNHIKAEDLENLRLGLIKTNRTKIVRSNVSGVLQGYDVFAGGANYNQDGTHNKGMAGGFVGFNNEGLLQNNNIYYADTIRGTSDLIGPFTGVASLNSNYKFNTIKNIEGLNNNYRVYRNSLEHNVLYDNQGQISNAVVNGKWNEFVVEHILDIDKYNEFNGSYISNGVSNIPSNVYVSSAKAVLMDDNVLSDNGETSIPPPTDMQDPCKDYLNLTINKVWKDFRDLDKIRPNEITVRLYRTYVDKSKVEVKDLTYNEVIKIKPSMHKNSWQYIVNNLPSYKVLDDGSNAFYKYYATEDNVEGYGTTIEYSNDGFTITITNTHIPLLPETGGVGVLWFIEIGLLGILLILTSYIRRKRI